MSSVYEALQRARQGAGGAAPAPAPVRTPQQPREASRELTRPASGPLLPPGPLAATLMPLLAAVRPLLDSKAGAVLHVLASTPGEGASTVAREFAMLTATTGQRRTLLLDADRHNPQTAKSFGCDTGLGILDCLRGAAGDADVLHPVPGTLLSVAALIGERGPSTIETDLLRELYAGLREQFELTVVDCPPVEGGAYADLVPSAADGIILVVQAERTRPVVVARANALIQQAGGHVLGAVLNKRTNYIPDFLYRLL